MVFPSTLVVTTMFHTLHDRKSSDTKSRLHFFAVFFTIMFVSRLCRRSSYLTLMLMRLPLLSQLYQFLPALFMPTLSSIAILCLFNNKNNAFRVLSSGYKGFGLPNISLDWNAIAMSGPLYQPWWAALNYYIGIAGAMYILMPWIYFRNVWNASKFPSPIDAALYQNVTYAKFNITALLKPDHTLDWDLFNAQKPVLLTPWCE
jgi:hypothetical protein